MDTLEQLIAKFDREYPDDMKLARKALQANPLKASNLIDIDITDALLCHEINRLRAELAVLRGRIADDAALVSEYTLLLRDAYNLCNPAWPWMHGLRERIRAALAAKEE